MSKILLPHLHWSECYSKFIPYCGLKIIFDKTHYMCIQGNALDTCVGGSHN